MSTRGFHHGWCSISSQCVPNSEVRCFYDQEKPGSCDNLPIYQQQSGEIWNDDNDGTGNSGNGGTGNSGAGNSGNGGTGTVRGRGGRGRAEEEEEEDQQTE
ncbi:hypothetical protein ACTFIW_001006 [Dictyostelium discoideum]